jgi:hypothetical protein
VRLLAKSNQLSKGGCALKRLSEDFRVLHDHGWLDQDALRGRSAVLPTYLAVKGACESKKRTPPSTGASSPGGSTARGRSPWGLRKRRLTTTPTTSTGAADVAIIVSHATSVSRLAGPARSPPGAVTSVSGKGFVKMARYRGNPDALRATRGGKET